MSQSLYLGGMLPVDYGSTTTAAASGAVTGAAYGASLGSAIPIIGTVVGAAAGAVIGGLVQGIQGRKTSKAQALKAAKQIGLTGKDAEGLYDWVNKALTWDKDKVKHEYHDYRSIWKAERDGKADIWQTKTWFHSEKHAKQKMAILVAVAAARYGMRLDPHADNAADDAKKKGKGKGKEKAKGKTKVTGRKTAVEMTTGTRTATGFEVAPVAESTFPWKWVLIGGGGLALAGALAYYASRKPRRTGG